VRIAHVRERTAPAGTPFRLAAALGPGDRPQHWLDLEVARRRLVAADPGRAHNSASVRVPLTTLDDHLARGLRVAALGEVLDHAALRAAGVDADDPDDDANLDAADLQFGPPLLHPPSFRDFYSFERHVATIWGRRGVDVPEAWYRLPIFYFSNTSEIRGPDEPVWAPRGSAELDFELELGALVDTPGHDLEPNTAADVIGGYLIVNDWSARDLQRDETTVRLGPAKGKDFATSIGPWLVTPDELADVPRSASGMPDLRMTATVRRADGRVVPVSDGRSGSGDFSFADMLVRASADVSLRPGDLVGSGTVGGGCLLEVRDDTLGRYLEPGDEVSLRVDRLGDLRSPIVERPARRG
jgi:fumarylacetoacetate (FAA) hydrolase